ncbi:MAG: hypothetical protein TE42_02375 [Candidatus Synechococcus spongiarum SP3]|uniref:Uncharacterized protein n=1 Tax=Candidatus Synechococcus spongiarum SP3 TaxID=1604020 RepID=A0A0G2HMA0_9SYNE|nr:MAG: hypothetical protein TE42_02375 [Candidatus Synechococcus spongiarum SP3]
MAALWTRHGFGTIALLMGVARKGTGQVETWAAGKTEPQYIITAATTPPPGETAHLCCGPWLVRLCKQVAPYCMGHQGKPEPMEERKPSSRTRFA